jgi:hypothetical protein
MGVAFSKIVMAGGKNREFNFRKISTGNASFYVDVTGDRGERIAFSLYREGDGTWQLHLPTGPAWIGEAVALLGNAIDAESAPLERPAPSFKLALFF